MITVEVAKGIVMESTSSLETTFEEVREAFHHVLADDVYAPLDLPPFHQSAMDGYAFRHADLAAVNYRLKVAGEVPAGAMSQFRLKEGEAVRIFTGAVVPENADTVVMQEKTNREGEWVTLTEDLPVGSNVRRPGEEIEKGSLAMERGTLINAAAVGFLSAMGCPAVPVFRKPKITLLITGNELVPPGEPLQHGQVYESNSATLIAALASTGFPLRQLRKLKDDYAETLRLLAAGMEKADVLIVSGGISVGDYDYVGKALKELGTEQLFYKIRQKPGKPMYFGRNGKTMIFALPGNPASLLTCFYEYVLPALRKMSGMENCFLTTQNVPLAQDYLKKGDRAQFLRGKLEGDKVTVLDGQSSFMMQAFAKADCLIYLPEDRQEIREGEKVEVHLLP